MSLYNLLPAMNADALLDGPWPDEPLLIKREHTTLDDTLTPELIWKYVDTGCIPADKIGMMNAGPGLHPGAFTTYSGPSVPGATAPEADPAKMRKLYEQGYTIRIGYLQKFIPYCADLIAAIQRETGFGSYVHAFATPAGHKGLRHHWDQQLGIIVQIEGTKRWPLWKPPLPAPMRAVNESFRVWTPEMQKGWETSEPDLTIDLTPGHALLIPRGWVHTPQALDHEASLHLTFALRERTNQWLAEQLVARAIQDPAFREIVTPDVLHTARLGERLRAVATMLTGFTDQLDLSHAASEIQDLMITDITELRR
jgi:hypothetical protein